MISIYKTKGNKEEEGRETFTRNPRKNLCIELLSSGNLSKRIIKIKTQTKCRQLSSTKYTKAVSTQKLKNDNSIVFTHGQSIYVTSEQIQSVWVIHYHSLCH